MPEDADGAGASVDTDLRACWNDLAAMAGVDDARDPELACDDRAVTHRAADVDHDRGGDQEQAWVIT